MTIPRSVAAMCLAAVLALGACASSQGSATPAATGPADSTTPAGSASADASATGSATTEPEPSATPEPEPTPTPTASPEPMATPEPEPTAEPIYQNIEDVEVGECFRSVKDADDGATLAASIVDCTEPHDSELFGLELVEGAPDAPYPGDEALDDPAIELCDAAFEDYVGVSYEESAYEYTYFTPSEATWSVGDREVICVIEHTSDVEESVRGSGG